MEVWFTMLGIDTDLLASYLSDPSPYHAKVLDPEDVMD